MHTYTDAIIEDIKIHKIEDKITNMEHEYISQSNISQPIGKYRIISERITRIQKHSERTCGKIPHGLDWSQQLKQSGLSYLLWKGIVTYIRRHLQIPQITYDKHTSLNKSSPITCDIDQAIKITKKKKEKLKSIQLKHGDLRNTHLESQAQYYAIKNNTTVEAYLKKKQEH
jgi:hypothetical protein